MPNHYLLQELEVFIRVSFLSEAEIASLVEEMDRSEREAGQVEREGDKFVDSEFRKAATAMASQEAKLRAESRILELQCDLETPFSVSVNGFQAASFVRL